MKLTDTDALRKAVRDDPQIDGLTYARVMRHIIEAERADAAPVVHAHWIRDDEYDICSHCRNPVILNRMSPDKFCKNCGASMDEKLKG